jgi:hypothetical protein
MKLQLNLGKFFRISGRCPGFNYSATARLAILPGITHYTIFASQMLVSTVNPFLDAPMPKAK